MPSSNTGPTSSRPGTSISENNIYSRITPFYVGGHTSKSRNPKIFELFTRMDLVERVGSGIPRIAEEMKAAGLPAPEYKTEGFFVTTLYKARPSDTSKTTDLGETTEKKTGKKTRKKTREIIRNLIRENPAITAEELAETIGMTRKGIEWHIAIMKSEGILVREGPDKGGRWVILDKK